MAKTNKVTRVITYAVVMTGRQRFNIDSLWRWYLKGVEEGIIPANLFFEKTELNSYLHSYATTPKRPAIRKSKEKVNGKYLFSLR